MANVFHLVPHPWNEGVPGSWPVQAHRLDALGCHAQRGHRMRTYHSSSIGPYVVDTSRSFDGSRFSSHHVTVSGAGSAGQNTGCDIL